MMKRYEFWLCQNDVGMSEDENGEWVNIKDLASYALIKKLEDKVKELTDIIDLIDSVSGDDSSVEYILNNHWRNR